MMTDHYEELALAEPIFGQLRNCMDLAVVGRPAGQRGPAAEGQLQPGRAHGRRAVEGGRVPAPQQVDTQASMVKRGTNWVISASGGVQINSWQAVGNQQPGEQLRGVRGKVGARPGNWWWD